MAPRVNFDILQNIVEKATDSVALSRLMQAAPAVYLNGGRRLLDITPVDLRNDRHAASLAAFLEVDSPGRIQRLKRIRFEAWHPSPAAALALQAVFTSAALHAEGLRRVEFEDAEAILASAPGIAAQFLLIHTIQSLEIHGCGPVARAVLSAMQCPSMDTIDLYLKPRAQEVAAGVRTDDRDPVRLLANFRDTLETLHIGCWEGTRGAALDRELEYPACVNLLIETMEDWIVDPLVVAFPHVASLDIYRGAPGPGDVAGLHLCEAARRRNMNTQENEWNHSGELLEVLGPALGIYALGLQCDVEALTLIDLRNEHPHVLVEVLKDTCPLALKLFAEGEHLVRNMDRHQVLLRSTDEPQQRIQELSLAIGLYSAEDQNIDVPNFMEALLRALDCPLPIINFSLSMEIGFDGTPRQAHQSLQRFDFGGFVNRLAALLPKVNQDSGTVNMFFGAYGPPLRAQFSHGLVQ